MGRKLRTIKQNVYYHVGSRCHNLINMMASDKMKEMLIEVVNKALEKYKFEMASYAIMNNHFHFVIKTLENEATISTIMQYIKSQYARKYNKMMNRTGAFWNERFFDVIIEETEYPEYYANNLMMYIAYNPVKSGEVSNAIDYKYSSIRAYLEKDYKSPIKITHHRYFLELGNNFDERKSKFLKIEDAYLKKNFPDLRK